MGVKSVLFLLLVVVALGQAQKKCCFPDQFEAINGIVEGTVPSGHGMVQNIGAQFALDYTNRRTGQLLTFSGHSFQQVLDYNKGAWYVVDLTMKTCQKLPLPIKPMQHCVPSNATFGGSFYFGDHKLNADSFNYYVNEGQTIGNVTLSVTKGNCIPFSYMFMGTLNGVETLLLVGYVNYNAGIQNPSKYFTLPSYCPEFFTPEPTEGYALPGALLL